MLRLVLAILALTAGVTSFVGIDTDGDGEDDTFTIVVQGVSYEANNCVEQVLHASNTHSDAGTIEICNNETHLFVKAIATYGLQGGDDQFLAWVGTDEADLPISPGGGLKNGQMPYRSGDQIDGLQWGFVIALDSLNSIDGNPVDCNAYLYVYIHVNVIDFEGQGQTAFGGDICYNTGGQDPTSPLNRWFCKSEYQAQCPDPPDSPPGGPGDTELFCQTAFAYGTHVLSWKFNPDNLPKYTYGMKTNRWGWFTHIQTSGATGVGELSYTIWAGAGRNIVSKAADVGTVVYTYSTVGGTPSVQIEIILNPGVIVNEYHAYVGDDPHLKAAAPGTYTDTQYPPLWEGETWSANQIFTYTHGQDLGDGTIMDLIDDDGNVGVWIGLHLSACREIPV